MHLVFLRYNAGHSAECAQRQGTCNWIIRMNYHEYAFDELVDIQDFFGMLFTLLTYAQYPEPQ